LKGLTQGLPALDGGRRSSIRGVEDR